MNLSRTPKVFWQTLCLAESSPHQSFLCICLNYTMYLSNFFDVFVNKEISICPDYKRYVGRGFVQQRAHLISPSSGLV